MTSVRGRKTILHAVFFSFLPPFKPFDLLIFLSLNPYLFSASLFYAKTLAEVLLSQENRKEQHQVYPQSQKKKKKQESKLKGRQNHHSHVLY